MDCIGPIEAQNYYVVSSSKQIAYKRQVVDVEYTSGGE